MTQRTVQVLQFKDYTVKVTYDRDWEEYRARLSVKGIPYEPADCFDTNRESILSTGKAMLDQAVQTNFQIPSN